MRSSHAAPAQNPYGAHQATHRARAGLEGTKTLLWPGIDIDIPTAENHSKCTPGGTEDAVLAAFYGGAGGVLISRKYSEMKVGTRQAAGSTGRQLSLGSVT